MRLTPWIAIILVSVGCRQDQDRPVPFATQVRDSAGIRIIENPRPPNGSRLGWQVADEPILTIGAVEGDLPYLLDDIEDATRLPDGSIVVASGGSNELRAFNASGAYVAAWSREGDGPGEFTSLAGLDSWPGDSLIAWNARGRAMSLFDQEGNLGRTFSLVDSEPATVTAALRDGMILSFRESGVSTAATPGGRTLSREAHFRINDNEGRPEALLGAHPSREIYSSRIAGQAFTMVVPFSPEVFAAAWGEFAVVAPNRRYELRAYGIDGTLMRIVRRDHALIPSTPAHLDAHFLDLLRMQGIRHATDADRGPSSTRLVTSWDMSRPPALWRSSRSAPTTFSARPQMISA